MSRFFNHFKTNFRIYFTIYGSIICALSLFSFFASIDGGTASDIIDELLSLILITTFFVITISALFKDNREVYSVLVPLYFSTTMFDYYLNSFSHIGELFDSDSFLEGFASFVALTCTICLGVLSVLAIYQVITKQENEGLMITLTLVLFSIFALSFILSLISLFAGSSIGFILVIAEILALPIAFVQIMTIATKSFVCDRPVFSPKSRAFKKLTKTTSVNNNNLDVDAFIYSEDNEETKE